MPTTPLKIIPYIAGGTLIFQRIIVIILAYEPSVHDRNRSHRLRAELTMCKMMSTLTDKLNSQPYSAPRYCTALFPHSSYPAHVLSSPAFSRAQPCTTLQPHRRPRTPSRSSAAARAIHAHTHAGKSLPTKPAPSAYPASRAAFNTRGGAPVLLPRIQVSAGVAAAHSLCQPPLALCARRARMPSPCTVPRGARSPAARTRPSFPFSRDPPPSRAHPWLGLPRPHILTHRVRPVGISGAAPRCRACYFLTTRRRSDHTVLWMSRLHFPPPLHLRHSR